MALAAITTMTTPATTPTTTSTSTSTPTTAAATISSSSSSSSSSSPVLGASCAPGPILSSTRVPIPSLASQDGRFPWRMIRRKTSEDAGLPLPSRPSSLVFSYPPSDHSTTESEPTARRPTRRGTWMRRLSTRSCSQHPEPAPPRARLSPSRPLSRGSVLPSNPPANSPANPLMAGIRPASPRLPNKLVKRSSSVRVPRQTPVQGPVSLRSSFRRPATSHQRSATLQHCPSRLATSIKHSSVHARPHAASIGSETEYTQYFTAKIAKTRPLVSRQGSTTHAHEFRRIYPDDKHTPTLVLARSISASAEDMDGLELTSDDGESVSFPSRPTTPLSMTAVFATKSMACPSHQQPLSAQAAASSTTSTTTTTTAAAAAAAVATTTTTTTSSSTATATTTTTTTTTTTPTAITTATATSATTNHAVRSRRSLSITDLLSAVPSSRLLRGFTQRASSTPLLPSMHRRHRSASHGLVGRDLRLAGREQATSAGLAAPQAPLSPGLPPAEARHVPSLPQDHLAPPAPASPNQMPPPSPSLAPTGARPSRYSMAPSDQASTLVGSSDNEIRGVASGDEDDADFQSETLFDSLRTGTTRSTSGGARGPRIDTIFDESPPSKVRITALRDLLPPGSFGEHMLHLAPGHQSIMEEEESISTPVRTIRPERSLHEAPSGPKVLSAAPLFTKSIPSSPPSTAKPLSLGTLEWDPRAGEDNDSSKWSLDEAEVQDAWVDLPPVSHMATPVSLSRLNPRLLASGLSAKPTTPQSLTADHPDRDTRSSIFDWSEQQIADKNSSNHSPPRPRTVHGKKDADHRGSRSVGRRVPSGLHARSQSVPVVPDAVGKRNTVVTNKFGTWGVGSKGVTEDWDDDFDFSDVTKEPAREGADKTPKTDSDAPMVVPLSIREQQNNVLANIGLLREWGLLIEELKEHRVRAVALDLLDGPHSGMWDEVDAMIDLADQEVEHENVARMSPPSSPGFDEDAFDDASAASPNLARGCRQSGSPNDDITKTPTPPTHPRRSILPSQYGIFSPQSSPVAPKSSKMETPPPPPHDQKMITTRPRKNSEAKARSVIEALQNKRKGLVESVPNVPPTPSKKVPFDTATLRRIVPYVAGLTRKVKDTIRDAEGLYASPHASPMNDGPSFNKIFQSDADLATQMKLMTVM